MVCLAWLKIRQTSTRGSTWPGCCCIALLPYKSVVLAEPPQQRLCLCQKCLGGVEVYKVGNVITHRFLPVTWKRQRWSHAEATKGTLWWKWYGQRERELYNTKGRTQTQRHISERHDRSGEDHWRRQAHEHSSFHKAWTRMTLETRKVKREKNKIKRSKLTLKICTNIKKIHKNSRNRITLQKS